MKFPTSMEEVVYYVYTFVNLFWWLLKLNYISVQDIKISVKLLPYDLPQFLLWVNKHNTKLGFNESQTSIWLLCWNSIAQLTTMRTCSFIITSPSWAPFSMPMACLNMGGPTRFLERLQIVVCKVWSKRWHNFGEKKWRLNISQNLHRWRLNNADQQKIWTLSVKIVFLSAKIVNPTWAGYSPICKCAHNSFWGCWNF